MCLRQSRGLKLFEAQKGCLGHVVRDSPSSNRSHSPVHCIQFISLDCNFIHSMKGFLGSTYSLLPVVLRTQFLFYFILYSISWYPIIKTLFGEFFQLHINGDLPHTRCKECLYNILESQSVNLKYTTVIRTLLSNHNAPRQSSHVLNPRRSQKRFGGLSGRGFELRFQRKSFKNHKFTISKCLPLSV